MPVDIITGSIGMPVGRPKNLSIGWVQIPYMNIRRVMIFRLLNLKIKT